MRLTYSLAREYIQRVFVETGAEISPSHSVELPADALTPALRAHLVRTVGPKVPAEFTLTAYSVNYDASAVMIPTASRITLDAPATEDDAPRLLAEDAKRWEAAEARRVVEAERRAAERAAYEAREREAAERRQSETLAEAQAQAQREVEKVSWVAAHGSEFLRTACAAGYDCQRRYVTERAAVEFPGYVVDFNDRAAWRSRSCPSERALVEALAVGGTVVWLTRPATEDEYHEDCEAVVIRQYLGKYDLTKAL